MTRTVSRILIIGGLIGLLFACAREPELAEDALLQHVPADTPYVFVNTRKLPAALGERLADHYAAQMAVQRASLVRLRDQIGRSEETAPMAKQANPFFDVLDALFAEFEGRGSASQLRELGIEPVTRSVFYGIGVLPAVRVEIADADRLNALLDRVEQRAGVQTQRGDLAGQGYRRIDLGPVDMVLSVNGGYAVGGLLADALFDRHLPLLLGQQMPARSLATSGSIEALIDRHGFTGYGEGYIKLDQLMAILLGREEGLNAEVAEALGERAVVSDGCVAMAERLLSGMPRMTVGVTRADERQLAVRGVWESSPAVAAYLQKIAAPVPGVGSPYDGLLAVGMGVDLPQLRNAIDALLREVVAAGQNCEWVDPDKVRAVMPQLNLALGPMTAGIKGFNLQLDDLEFDPQTLEPVSVRAALLGAVDDPRGMFALGAMFNPALAAIEIPNDGSPVELAVDESLPPIRVAIKDKALLLLAGDNADEIAGPLLDARVTDPAPLVSVDYGIRRLVERFGVLLERVLAKMDAEGQQETAGELREQLQGLRLQAEAFERLRVSVHASNEGLIMDQVMELR